ncbi:DUF2339 domain-containing protein [Haloferula sp. BvORR071]|uniref:DUF2339 domain-containing protein n=1 Tax=Haloferula sp. BvORR071 TaxID=1396141 RepID=UPI000556C01E|nr:DUF2339 domain-containing protein [Haloferula sp. BvORR071]
MECRHAEEIQQLRYKLQALAESLLTPEPEKAPALPTFETRAPLVPEPAPVLVVEQKPVPVSAPPPPPPYPVQRAARASAEAAPLEVPKAAKGSFELQLGRVWLVRIGIALLLTGLVLLGNYAYRNWVHDLPPIVRLVALYCGSFLMCGAGYFCNRRDDLRKFSEVVMAGGLAFFYWCTFAAHHVPRLQVIESRVTAGVMLLGAASVIVGVALRRDSRITAMMGLLLACYATILQPLGWLSAASNVVLAVAATGLMMRRAWAGPGIATMAGIYLSFLWWQIAGAAGGGPVDPSALYFLPPVWLVFALSGLHGIGHRFSALSERGRALLASVNNLAFFGLFTGVWLLHHGRADYWQVPAVFGSVLVIFGVIGRWKNPASAAHLGQGLAALTLAMVLKLEGDALATGFAIQALLLSIAFARFRGRIEVTFAALAAVGAAAWLIAYRIGEIPVWSRGVCALLISSSVLPLIYGSSRSDVKPDLQAIGRSATSVVLAAASAAILLGWSLYLEPGTRYLTLISVGMGMSAATLLADKQRCLRDLAFWAGAFHAAGIILLLGAKEVSAATPVYAVLIAMASHWLWVHRVPAGELGKSDPLRRADIFQWLTALTVSVGAYQAIDLREPALIPRMLIFGTAALALAAAGRYLLRSPVLVIAAALLMPELIRLQLERGSQAWISEFLPLLACGGLAAIAHLPGLGKKSLVAGTIARALGTISWTLAWRELSPEHWGEIMALSALGVMAIPKKWSKDSPLEGWAFLVLTSYWLGLYLTVCPWHEADFSNGPQGWVIPLVLFTIPFVARVPEASQRIIRQALLALACAVLAAWSTELLVRYAGWKPVAPLWTVLGFVLVSTGLWRKLAVLRHAGFALLAFAVAKLFISDVWDFGTFYRIVAFIALGVALVVLGFFYNRFAEVLKKLLEADEA